MFPSSSDELVPLVPTRAVLDLVHEGGSQIGVVPAENSVQGVVSDTIDALIFDYSDLYVCGETAVAVTFCAFRRPGDIGPVRAVLSHPYALAQCNGFVKKLKASAEATESTAQACAVVAGSSRTGLVAIGSKAAGELHSLSVIASGIEDHRGAVTKFFAVSLHFPPPSGNDRSLIVLSPPNMDAEHLVAAFALISRWRIKILAIYPRAARSALGQYRFVVFVEGHLAQADFQGLIRDIIASGIAVQFLGSFPAGVDVSPSPFPRLCRRFLARPIKRNGGLSIC